MRWGGGGRDGGGFDEEAQGGVKAGEGARQRGRVIDEKKKKGIECERGGEGDGQSGRRGDRNEGAVQTERRGWMLRGRAKNTK